ELLMKKRTHDRELFALFVLSTVALAASCNAIFGIEEAQEDPTYMPGAGGQGGASCAINKTLDGAETDVDCGGTACPKCDSGRHCNKNSDCKSGTCMGGMDTSSSSGQGGASNGSSASSST